MEIFGGFKGEKTKLNKNATKERIRKQKFVQQQKVISVSVWCLLIINIKSQGASMFKGFRCLFWQTVQLFCFKMFYMEWRGVKSPTTGSPSSTSLTFGRKNGLPGLHCWSLCALCGFWADLKRFLGVSAPTVSSLYINLPKVGESSSSWEDTYFKSAQKPHGTQRDQQWSSSKPIDRIFSPYKTLYCALLCNIHRNSNYVTLV